MFCKSLLLPSIAIASFVISSLSQAVALSYTVSGGSVSANSGDGLIIETSLNLPSTPFTFSLNDGESRTFSFFNIWTPETAINPDDQIARDIAASLSFSEPATSAAIDGLTFGGSFLWGAAQWGEVKWDNPAPIFNVAGRTFQISLSNEVFNEGAFGLNEGWHYGATVKATVKQIGTYSAVPDGGNTAMFLGLSLLGIALLKKTRAAFF